MLRTHCIIPSPQKADFLLEQASLLDVLDASRSPACVNSEEEFVRSEKAAGVVKEVGLGRLS